MIEERGWGEVEREEGRIVELRFTIPGRPRTWQRARRGRHGPMFTPADIENKMSEVRDCWKSLDVPPFGRDVFLALGVAVYLERPQSHYGTGRNAGALKPQYATARPGVGKNGGDLDNFVKLVKDALNKVAYHDDGHIAEYLLGTGKWYAADGTMPRTEVRLRPLAPVDVAELSGQEVLLG